MIKILKKTIIVLLIFLLTGCSQGRESSQKQSTTPSSFSITFLSVGQADAAVVACDGHYAMIDCGSESVQENGFSSYKVDLFLEQEGITSFDYIFCSHYDEDHYAGFADILDGRKIGKAYGPSGINDIDVQSLNRFKNALSDQHKKIKTPKVGESFDLGSSTIEEVAVDSNQSIRNRNDSSLVLLVTYGETKFLFTGDAESKTETTMINGKISIKCDVLKVAHHGSPTSTSESFLAKAKPTYAILTVAPDRDLPNGVVFDRLEAQDSIEKIFRTDETGNITCKSDGKNITIYNTDGVQINE